VCCVNIIDSQFIADASKFLSASLVSLSAMMSLELPHINVLSKVDILKRTLPKRERKKALDRFLDMDVAGLIARVKPVTEKHMRLTDAIGSLLQDFNMVSYVPLDASDPDSVSLVLSQIDHAIQVRRTSSRPNSRNYQDLPRRPGKYDPRLAPPPLGSSQWRRAAIGRVDAGRMRGWQSVVTWQPEAPSTVVSGSVGTSWPAGDSIRPLHAA